LNSFLAEDGKTRCGWCSAEQIYIDYHDNEWGRPVVGDDAIFQRISLEGFQAGLNWLMILKRREHLRSRFNGFSIEKVSRMSDQDVASLMSDPMLIRNQRKIESVIANAKLIAEQKIPISDIVWSFQPKSQDDDYSKTSSKESIALSKELKSLGFSFVGPTTMYAMMQSIGMVNDHHPECYLK
jgi:DNA-3-methyladenine glycosylase I